VSNSDKHGTHPNWFPYYNDLRHKAGKKQDSSLVMMLSSNTAALLNTKISEKNITLLCKMTPRNLYRTQNKYCGFLGIMKCCQKYLKLMRFIIMAN
jgi:hypothetical protein